MRFSVRLDARLDYHHPLDLGEEVELVESAGEDAYSVAFAVGADGEGSRARRGLRALSQRLEPSYPGLRART